MFFSSEGAIFDATGSYTLSFVVSGVLIGLSGILCLPVRRLSQWENGNKATVCDEVPIDLPVPEQAPGSNDSSI